MKKHLRMMMLGLAVAASACGQGLPEQEEPTALDEVSQGLTVVGTSNLYGPNSCGYPTSVSPNTGSIVGSSQYAWRFVNTTQSTLTLRIRRWGDPPPSSTSSFSVSIAPGGYYDLNNNTSCEGTCVSKYFQIDGDCSSGFTELARIYYR